MNECLSDQVVEGFGILVLGLIVLFVLGLVAVHYATRAAMWHSLEKKDMLK